MNIYSSLENLKRQKEDIIFDNEKLNFIKTPRKERKNAISSRNPSSDERQMYRSVTQKVSKHLNLPQINTSCTGGDQLEDSLLMDTVVTNPTKDGGGHSTSRNHIKKENLRYSTAQDVE